MALIRRLPISDQGRIIALTQAKTKMSNPGPAGNFLKTSTQTRLTAIQAIFHDALRDAGVAKAGQAGSTGNVISSKVALQLFISHFIQVFNFGVARGKFPNAHRAFFQLDVESVRLPRVRTEAEIIQWGKRIVEGDARRVAAGGVAMTDPATSEVAAALTAFTSANTTQSGLKDAYGIALEVIESNRKEADRVIKKVWDEVETFYDEEPASGKRRKAREWGVAYISDVPITIHISVKAAHTHQPIENARVELMETGSSAHTNAAGQADIVTSFSHEECTLRASKVGYMDQDFMLTITGESEYAIEIVMMPV